jgi:malate dehydrogenase (oxaloacetate-decarboxylating)
VFHDDQHGTAIVCVAALRNALKVVGKNIGDVKLVMSGAGAAGTAVLKLMFAAGLKHATIVDQHGIIFDGREGIASDEPPTAQPGALQIVFDHRAGRAVLLYELG